MSLFSLSPTIEQSIATSSQISDNVVTIRKFMQRGAVTHPFGASQPVNRRWDITGTIGSGTYGTVFKAVDANTGSTVAIKVDKRQQDNSIDQEQLFFERLQRLQSTNGFAVPIWIPIYGNTKYMVMPLLGKFLEDKREEFEGSFALKTILLIGKNLINRLEVIHRCGFVHRDIKPDNIMLGRPGSGDEDTLYVIDFGTAVRYIDEAGRHIAIENQSVHPQSFGTVAAHNGFPVSRGHDFESMMYTLVFIYNGNLPWLRVHGIAS